MKLSTKLITLSAILSSFSVIIALLSMFAMSNMDKDTQALSTNWLPTIKVVGELNGFVNEYRRNELVHILSNDEALTKEYENRLRIGYEIFAADSGKRTTTGYTIQVAVEEKSREMSFVSPDILFERMGVKP